MNILFEEHLEILKLFNDNGVRYLLIGGYAVIAHGYNRTTGDMDLWLSPDNENKKLLISALRKYGIEEADLLSLEDLDFSSTLVFSLGIEPYKIDFLTKVNLIEFESAFLNKISIQVDEIQLPILQYTDLILSKMNTGRAKDIADIEELQRLNKK